MGTVSKREREKAKEEKVAISSKLPISICSQGSMLFRETLLSDRGEHPFILELM